MTQSSPTLAPNFFSSLVRLSAYLLLIGIAAGLITLDAFSINHQLFSETSFVESAQLVLLAGCALLCFGLYRKRGAFSHSAFLMGNFFLASFIRENDALLDSLLFHGSWKFLTFPLVAWALWRAWKNRRALLAELNGYISSVACGFFFSGFMTTYLFSRFFGRSFIWENIMRENYVRNVKNAAEESVELLGYALLFCATIELLALARPNRRSDAKEIPPPPGQPT